MAMTDAQRRFAAARDELITQFYNPFAKLLDAAQAAVVEADRRAERAEARLEMLYAESPLAVSAPELLSALDTLMNAYIELADSGDAGYWKAEDTVEGKKALAAIAKARGQTEG